MQKPQRTSKNDYGLLLYLAILTLFFFFLQISFLIRYSGFYLGDIKEVASHLKVPFKVISPVLFFVAVQISFHILFVFLIWLQAQWIGCLFKFTKDKIEKTGFFLWALTIIAVILANQFYFPNSRFASLTDIFFNHFIAGLLLSIISGVLFFALLLAIVGAIKSLPWMVQAFFSGLILIVFGYGHYNRANIQVTDASSSDKPNIIIIGIDALRPDFLGYFGYEKHTPYLDDFFNHSTVFAESLTPIARTFPAWISILTGEYPKQNGARTDLQQLTHINLGSTLSNILKQDGYTTLYASDETRFSNIDERFGFERIITPPTGFNDFFLGTMNDFPFSNLIVNTALGKRLFPYSYGNRPVYATYDPDSFLELLKPALKAPRKKPLFLAIHFCLPHTPYYWGTQLLHYRVINNYQAAIHRIDQQFNDFVQLLEQNKILEHAIVVILSDHGETIELNGDRATNPELFVSGNLKNNTIPQFYPVTSFKEKVDQVGGHGTDVLGLPQYHTVLAFRLFGMQPNQTHVISGRVSLLDIKPTIMGLLKMNLSKSSGQSRVDNILGNSLQVDSNNDFFIESDFSPEAVHSAHPEVREVLFEGISYFQIDPETTRLYVKDSMEKLIISSKQYADFYGEWVLALYPQNDSTMMPILVNLKTGMWTNDLRTPFALQSPADHMLRALQNFYGNELKKIMNIA